MQKSNQGLNSLSGKTSYRQISWSLKAARLDNNASQYDYTLFSFTLFSLLPWLLSNSEPLGNSTPESRGFETCGKTSVCPLSE